MKIDFSDEQFRTLIEMAYIGNWMINSFRADEEKVAIFDELERYIFSFAEECDCGEEFDYIEELEGIYPTLEKEVELRKTIEDYNDYHFWEILTARLAEEEMVKIYGSEQVKGMSDDDYLDKIIDIEDRISSELEKNGLKNVDISGFKVQTEM